MINPFQIIHYKGPQYFCDREQETKELTTAILNGRSVTLFSIRRIGKTGLIHHVLNRLKTKSDVIPIYVDIYDTRSERDFVNAISSAVLRSFEKDKENFIRQIGHFFGRYRPQISFDVMTGNPNVSLDIQNSEDMELSMAALFSIIQDQKKQVVIAIDEFQEIETYPNSKLAATLRKYLQEVTNLSIIFSGSKRSLLTSMFSSPKSILYRTTQLYELSKIAAKPYREFILFQFRQDHRKIDLALIDKILQWTRRHTYYTQYFCHRLFESGSKQITETNINEIKFKILKENEMVFYNYQKLLSRQQWKLLKAIGIEGEVREPTSAAFIQKYQLGAHSTVRLSLQKLLEKEMIYDWVDMDAAKGRSIYQVYDVFLEQWISYKHSKRI